jgi:2-polyprenyl-6-hydroxyphenyl methylase/3-demethylubiquinone-9 3-methyltransferase
VSRPRNDPAQYDDLADAWWDRRGTFAMLHWLAAVRASRVPAPRPGAILVDIGCGGGLLAPHIAGYRHIGIDVTVSALAIARQHGVTPVRADAGALPLRSSCADVVVAGEILEHVTDLAAVVAEACRVLKPGGTLVVDTIASTRLARFVAVTVAERIPGGAPPRLHDPALFVDRRQLVGMCQRYGITLRLRGLRPSLPGYLRWLTGRADAVRMVPSRLSAVLFQAEGVRMNESGTTVVPEAEEASRG